MGEFCMNFSKAIVRKPSINLAQGITQANLGLPDYAKACEQHQNYIRFLKQMNVEVIVLDALEQHPDATFVEDVAVLSEECAIITQPQEASRRAEIEGIAPVLSDFYQKIYHISAPGVLEGGDVLRIDNHFYVGLSRRTNHEGATQLKNILKEFGYTCSFIPLKRLLHLKTGVSYIGENTLVMGDEIREIDLFRSYHRIELADQDAYCANLIKNADHLIIPDGYPNVLTRLKTEGFYVYSCPMSEFQKIDGGLTCLSLRFD